MRRDLTGKGMKKRRRSGKNRITKNRTTRKRITGIQTMRKRITGIHTTKMARIMRRRCTGRKRTAYMKRKGIMTGMQDVYHMRNRDI